MPRGRYRSSVDQVFEFDRGRIVAYRDCGSSFREIGQRFRGNQSTVMRICHRWMQEETMDRRDPSHPPRWTIARDDRRIVRMAVRDRAATPRTDSVCHASFGVRLYHSTPFATEGNVRKASITSFTLNWKPQVFEL
ncbi:HTH_38 domain-containing protein [Trichonephila clavipes]|nr:HTH_38 domain-containing protein [Trichonephila clavipes]